MAITIARQENVAIQAGVSVQVAATRVGRVGAIVQVQADGGSWVDLDTSVAKGLGFFAGGWEILDLSIGYDSVAGNLVDFYEGPIAVLWEGGTVQRGADPEPQQNAVCRVIELT